MILKMMRFNHTILQVIPTLNAGGAERSTLEIASAIVKAGGRALVASLGGRLATEIELVGGEIIEMPVHSKNPITMLQNANRLSKLIEREGVDLVHARSRAPAWSALFATKRMRIPFVTTYHGAYQSVGRIKRYYNSSMLRADCVIANSRYTADAIAKLGAIEPQRLRVIPRGADIDVFDPASISERRVNQLTKNWGLTGENRRFRVLLPGRLTPWKGHEVAIEAINRLKSRHSPGNEAEMTLVFCGGAPSNNDYESTLRALIDQRGVRDMVHLVGDCSDMPAAYRWADLVLSPSVRPEAFGRVAIEAGAMETPIIATRHGGAVETVMDGTSGLLVDPDNAGELADAIASIWDMSVEERALMGQNGRARATSVYSASAMCDSTLRVYSDLLAVGEH